MNVLSSALAAAVLFTCSLAAQGQELNFAMKGEISASGKFLNVRAELGAGVTRAIRVYSEPSHTLLGVFVSNNVDDDTQRNWRTEHLMGVARVMEFAFTEKATAMLQMQRAPATDSKIQMVVFGKWPDNQEEERAITVTTNVDRFAFSYLTGGKQTILCCGASGEAGCPQDCISCTGNEFTCCTLQQYDAICGWCGKNAASCGTKTCNC